jgi:hypothetical protein
MFAKLSIYMIYNYQEFKGDKAMPDYLQLNAINYFLRFTTQRPFRRNFSFSCFFITKPDRFVKPIDAKVMLKLLFGLLPLLLFQSSLYQSLLP